MGAQICRVSLPEKSKLNQQQSSMIEPSFHEIQKSLGLENANQAEFPVPFQGEKFVFLNQFARLTQRNTPEILDNQQKSTLKLPQSKKPKFISNFNEKTSRKLIDKISSTKEIVFDFSLIQVTTEGRSRKSFITDVLKTYIQINSRSSNFDKIQINIQNFYQIKKLPINDQYELQSKIGEGSYGSVYRAKCKKSGQLRAIKILKKKFMNDQHEEQFIQQLNLLKKFDHVNIIKLYDIFFYQSLYYVVTEFCEGGTLLNAISKRKIKNQKDIAIIMRQILSAISYIHSMKIAHRDLKLQNIVVVKQITDQNIHQCVKIIDFGLASKVQKLFNNECGRVGTLSYMAPQVLKNKFSCHCDIWSAGVMLCILLIGYNPFWKRLKEPTIKAILENEIDFTNNDWRKVSNQAKKLVSSMLQKKPQKRIPISKALNHQWFKVIDKKIEMSKSTLANSSNQSFMNNISNYYRGSNFLMFVKNYMISKKMTQVERQQMAIMFAKIDLDHSGFLEIQQLIQLCKTVKGQNIGDSNQIRKMVQKIDENKSGRIDFQQFLLVMADMDSMKSKQYLAEAFEFVDRDDTGYLQKQELLQCLQGSNSAEIQEILSKFDYNGDGKISRQEFIKYMQQLNV